MYTLKFDILHHVQIMDTESKKGIAFPVGPSMAVFIQKLVNSANMYDSMLAMKQETPAPTPATDEEKPHEA